MKPEERASGAAAGQGDAGGAGRRGNGKTTLKDVAARAGVSIKTVSNVVNGYAHITPETRTRVEAAIEELGYRPNLSARHLRRGASGIIALVVPELDVPYFAELARHVIGAAAERSLTVIIDQTDGDPERERFALDGDRALLLDGLILSPLGLSREELAERRDRTPLVLLGEHISGGPVDHVWIDNVAAARAATEHLLALGRRRIAAIGDQPYEHGETAQLRTRGFVTALQEAGIAPDQELIVPVPRFHREHGARAMEQLLDLEQPPDAVFAFNDLVALGALRVALARGLRVPEDVAIVGFDDVEDGRYSTPTLTTIAPDKERIARLALDSLTARIDGGGDHPARELEAPFELVVRESTVGRG